MQTALENLSQEDLLKVISSRDEATFKGYLQTDGYAVYEKYGRKKDVTHLACWAHARREFERALDNDKARAEKALLLIQQLYAIERRAKQEGLPAERLKELRLAESLPVINELGKWIFEEIKSTLPKSQIGKAMAYAYARWDALSAYLYDGNLQIDNNLVENAIRPVAGKTTCSPEATKRRSGQP